MSNRQFLLLKIFYGCGLILGGLLPSLAMAQTALSAVSPNTAQAFADPLSTPALQSKLATRVLLNAVAVTEKRVIAVGIRGHIVVSEDQGSSWQQSQVPVSSDLTCLSMATDLIGWAGGHDGVILITEDGGKTWQKQMDGLRAATLMRETAIASGQTALITEAERYVSEGATRPILGIWFANAHKGWAVGAYGQIFSTTDGGKNWRADFDRIDNPKFLHFNAIHGEGDQVFIAGEMGMVWRLIDNRWQAIQTPYIGSFFDLQVRGGSIINVGMRANVWQSHDQGASWHKINVPERNSLTAITQFPDGRYAITTQSGRVLISENQANGFKVLPNISPMIFSGIGKINAEKIVLVGMGGVRVESLPAR